MTTATIHHHTLGEPQVSGPLAVFPVFGPRRTLRYRSLAQAAKHGAFISEVREGASVNDVLVCNASDRPVLLYEGELILGAQQNRTIDQPVLVPAAAELAVPVSCVEQGRWQASRHRQPFAPAPYAVDPSLRGRKRGVANARSAAGDEARPEQGEVWAEVDARLDRHRVDSPTGAFTDLYEARRGDLDGIAGEIHHVDRQIGAIAQLGGRTIALDCVGRPRVFADLLPRLTAGYALQALELKGTGAAAPPSRADAAAFLAAALEAPKAWQRTPGMGDAFALTATELTGCLLRAEGELVALSAFPTGEPIERPPGA